MKKTILNFLGVAIVLVIAIYIAVSIFNRATSEQQGNEFQVQEPPSFVVYSQADESKEFRLNYLNNKAAFEVDEGFCFAVNSMTVFFSGEYEFTLMSPDGATEVIDLSGRAEHCLDGISEVGEYEYRLKYKQSSESDYIPGYEQIVNVTIE